MALYSDARTAIKLAIGVASTSFLGLMTILCMLLRPEMFDHPHWGLSYFGSQRITIVPYYLGFTIVIACLGWVTSILWKLEGRWRPIRAVFLISTLLSACIAATSDMQGPFLYWSHIYLCFALLPVVLWGDIWLLLQRRLTWMDYVATVILIVGIALVILSSNWLDILGIYYWGEVVLFIGAFACLGRAALRAVNGSL